MKQVGLLSKLLACAVALGALLVVETAQAGAGKATVRAVRGSADFSDGSGSWKKIKVGVVLKQGAVIRTAAESSVDLFLDQNGPVVRVTENSQLGLDRLTFEDSGVETVIDTGLNLKDGRILGNVKKLAQASKYEVKTPNGVAGIRGTEYDISANGKVLVITGSVVVVEGGQTHVVNAGESFDPTSKAVKKADPQVLAAVTTTIKDVVTVVTTPDGDTVQVIPQPAKDPSKGEPTAVDNYRNTQTAGSGGQ
jgi:hypothetical protein